MLHLDARREARFNEVGELVILSEQNRQLWSVQKIQEANQLVEKALMIGKGTPYALQAAIASLHNNARNYVSTDWPQIYELYKLLNNVAPNPIVEINGWIAFAQFSDANTAIEKIKSLEKSVGDYRQFNVTIAGLYFEENNFEAARKYYLKALDFVNNATEESFITKRLNLCNDNLKSSL